MRPPPSRCLFKCWPRRGSRRSEPTGPTDSDAVRAVLAAAGKEVAIPPKANRLRQPVYDKSKYRERNRIERLVGRLKQFRAVATRYDKLDAMFMGGVLAALALIHLQ